MLLLKYVRDASSFSVHLKQATVEEEAEIKNRFLNQGQESLSQDAKKKDGNPVLDRPSVTYSDLEQGWSISWSK